MFHEMRRKDRTAGEEVINRLLQQGEYGVLATVGENGYPYSVPLNYVYMNEAVYFHCATVGQKLENIKNSDRVSFCIVENAAVIPAIFSTSYESIILFGKAALVTELGEKTEVLVKLVEKYSAGYEEQGFEAIQKALERTNVVKIQIEHITGKKRGTE